MILAEITAAVDDVGTTTTLYAASGSYRTKPTDVPANENFVHALSDPGSLGVSVYRDGATGGYGTLEVGQLKLVNSDGRFDHWIDYGFDGRDVILRLYREGVSHQLMPILFRGTVDGPPEITRDALTLRLRDKAHVLEVPACPRLYGGGNIPPNGVDGLASDLKGKRKPRCYGRVLNMSPEQVNTSLQIFQVHDGAVADITAVYQKGAPFTKHNDYPNNAALQAATVPSGNYATCFAEGLFRLNTTIDGQITADVTEGATAGLRTAGQIIKRIALAAGLGADEISATDLVTLDAQQSATVGIHLTGEVTAREAISLVAESIGAFAVFDSQGVLRMGRLSEPTGAPPLILNDGQVLDIQRQAQRDGDLPNYLVTLNHTRNWTVQSSDIAGSVSADRRNFLKDEFRRTYAEAPSVKLKHKLSPAITASSLLVDEDNATDGPAQAEASRLLALYRVRRDLLEVKLHIDVIRNIGLPGLMTIIQLNSSRPGITPGSLFWVLGFRLELRQRRVALLLWG